MKRTFSIVAAFLAAFTVSYHLQAKGGTDQEGMVTYSLPSTVITLDVEAVQESFHAGPYARYAEKYLGIKARQKDENSVRITSIDMVPSVEADQSRRYSVQVSKGIIDGSVFALSSAGLVSLSDATFGNGIKWRLPASSEGDFSAKGVSSNLTSESATLYRNNKKESSFSKVSVRQDMVVEKSLEKKAAETAQVILNLREKRLQIVTGDTDATYSGEAMGAAISELARLEEEYMSLFIGYSDYRDMSMSFDVIPDSETLMYVAFRISDTAGLLPADNLAGKPVVMEIVPQTFAEPELPEKADKIKKEVSVRYRIPAMCTVKILDGMNLLLQGRIPVYQLGRESAMPVNLYIPSEK